MDTPLSVAAVIPSVDRHDALMRVVDALLHQTQRLHQVVVVVPEEGGVPAGLRERAGVKVIVGPRGASRQRNAGVAALDPEVEAVIFLDDDSLPREDYAARVVEVFAEQPGTVAVTGRMACDGAASKVELTPDQMAAALTSSHEDDQHVVTRTSRTLYGCNMAVRRSAIDQTPFDEALPLYSWLEDLDVARRLERLGAVVYDSRCVVAHQGNASGGRTQHVRFGYSSVVNPVYLERKGSLSRGDVARLVLRPVVANLALALCPGAEFERGERRARLRGQLLGLGDLLRGRVSPGRIADF